MYQTKDPMFEEMLEGRRRSKTYKCKCYTEYCNQIMNVFIDLNHPPGRCSWRAYAEFSHQLCRNLQRNHFTRSCPRLPSAFLHLEVGPRIEGRGRGFTKGKFG